MECDAIELIVRAATLTKECRVVLVERAIAFKEEREGGRTKLTLAGAPLRCRETATKDVARGGSIRVPNHTARGVRKEGCERYIRRPAKVPLHDRREVQQEEGVESEGMGPSDCPNGRDEVYSFR